MANEEIRQEIEKRRLKYYEVAKQLNIAPATLTRWLRFEVSGERKKEILTAIRNAKW